MENLLIVGITCSLLLSSLILTKQVKSFADKIFLIWQCVLILHFSLLFIRYSDLYAQYPHFIALDTSFGLLHVPLLYVYIRSLTSGHYGLRFLSVHFIPFIVINILLAFNFYFLPAEDKMFIYLEALEIRKISITDIIIILQSMLYFPLLLQAIGGYNKRIKTKFSSIDKINLEWLRKIIIVFIVGFGLKLIYNLLVLTEVISGVIYEEITVAVFCFLILFLGYHGIKSTHIFHQKEIFTEKGGIDTQYSKSGLRESDMDGYVMLLRDYMKEQKPYLNDELTLAQLANELDISSNNLSQVINQGIGKSFYDFVNEYRIKEVKERLEKKEYQHLKILAVALESGFKSKSTFNSFFKKTVGQTPSEFKKSISISSN